MKKIYLVLILGITMGLALTSDGYCAWPINRTRPIEGRITDATTGKPIEKVILLCSWRKEEIVGLPSGPRSSEIGYEYGVTDKDGRYRLPAKISFHIGTGFDSLDLTIMHPLYESKTIRGFYLKLHRSKKWIYRNERGEKLDLVPKKGIIYYNIFLLSLDEKYKGDINRQQRQSLEDEFLNGNNYFIGAKEIGVSMDHLKIFAEWEKIAKRFSLYLSVEIGKKRVLEVVNK